MATKMMCLVLMFLSFYQIVSARNCWVIEEILDCNDCFRCGGHWCNSPTEKIHCRLSPAADWCPGYREVVPQVERTKPGVGVSSVYQETTARVGADTTLSVVYKSSSAQQTVQIKEKQSSQSADFKVTTTTNCNSLNCTTTITANPGTEFCSAGGKHSEFFNVTLKVSDSVEDVMVKYNVPCSCKCSEKEEKRSPRCNGWGDYSCGVCTCRDGWTGDFCEQRVCEENRGDLPTCINPERPNMECSGNGYCGKCDSCVCFTDREGYQYFSEDDYCSDVCMNVVSCEDCWRDPAIGECDRCNTIINFLPLNLTLASQKDSADRNVWVKCNDTLPNDCHMEFMAMRDEYKNIHVMVKDFCFASADETKTGVVTLKVPIILLGVAIAVAATATAAYFVYKNRMPPPQTSTPTYVNIDSEDCTGINPLYKPATSSYKNPTFGKAW